MANAKSKNVNVTTPVGVFKFPKLNAPDTKFNAAGVYEVKLILSAADSASLLAKLQLESDKAYADAKMQIEETIATSTGEKKGKALQALQKLSQAPTPGAPVYSDSGEETGEREFKFKMNASRTHKETKVVTHQCPKFFDAAGKEIKNPPAIWGGTKGAVSGQIVPYYVPGTNTAGVGLRMSAVQLVKVVNSSSGSAEMYGFGKQDGYTADEDEGGEGGFSDQTDGAAEGGTGSVPDDEF
jgi:hypothetical protein